MNYVTKTSAAGLEFIARWEGVVLTPYMDVAGLWTIGVGHLIKDTDSFSAISNDKVRSLLSTKDKSHPCTQISIPREEALSILASDVKLVEEALVRTIKVKLNQNQFDAMVSFGFNCGTGVFKTSGACKAITEGKFDIVPEKLLDWSKVRINGELKTNKGLLARRTAEGQLFLKEVSNAGQLSPTLFSHTPEMIKDIQTKLKKLGFYIGLVDGIKGPQTTAAMEKFSKAKNVQLPSNGVSTQWMSELNKACQ